MSEAQVDSAGVGGLIVPDFSECQDRVGVGEYKVRIVGHKFSKWEGKDGKPDTPYVAWTLETFGEPDEKNNGRKIFHNTPFVGKGAFRGRDFYKAVMGEECPPTGFDPAMLYGREVSVTIAAQKNDPQYNEIKLVKAIAATVQ